jgi:hypothetical protein
MPPTNARKRGKIENARFSRPGGNEVTSNSPFQEWHAIENFKSDIRNGLSYDAAT